MHRKIYDYHRLEWMWSRMNNCPISVAIVMHCRRLIIVGFPVHFSINSLVSLPIRPIWHWIVRCSVIVPAPILALHRTDMANDESIFRSMSFVSFYDQNKIDSTLIIWFGLIDHISFHIYLIFYYDTFHGHRLIQWFFFCFRSSIMLNLWKSYRER